MRRLSILVACISVLLFGTVPASASIITYNVILSGAESVPVVVTTASGSATVTIDDVADTVQVVLNFTGLIGGPASAAHIHCCVLPTANGPVVIPFTGFPTSTSGTYSNTFTGISSLNILGIEAGLAYINIHDTIFPGGEIRGDILPQAIVTSGVPEPDSIALLALGSLALLGVRRARMATRGNRVAATRGGRT
jgi:CHRD domain/PEP-CTERM motif